MVKTKCLHTRKYPPSELSAKKADNTQVQDYLQSHASCVPKAALNTFTINNFFSFCKIYIYNIIITQKH